MATHRGGLFPALLKHWRGMRGLSQLDLAMAADVSSRHISFLETGRSAPSEQMVLRLAKTLDVPLRQINAMLQAAGFPTAYPETQDEHTMPVEITDALHMMKEHQDPYPLVVVDGTYNVVDLNTGAIALFQTLTQGGAFTGAKLNLAHLTFHPSMAHGALLNFDEVGQAFLWRLQREVLAARCLSR